MAKSLRLKLAVPLCWAISLTTCSALAMAAEKDVLVSGVDAIPFEELRYVWFIIFLGAVLSTLIKMSKLDRPQFRSVPLEIAKDIVGSVCAGGLMFLGMLWVNKSLYEIDILGRFIAIFFASYGGSRGIEIAYEEGFSSWIKGLWARVTGKMETAVAPAVGGAVLAPAAPVRRERNTRDSDSGSAPAHFDSDSDSGSDGGGDGGGGD